MAAIAPRLSPQQAHQHLMSDPGALLVCAYDNEQKFQQNHLEGAISLDEFKSRVDSLRKNQEIIFYCA